MTDFRKRARGQNCLVRLPGCKGGGPTVILSHYRLAGYSGTGMKPDDVAFGAYCCAHCHDVVDGRKKSNHDQKVIRLAHAEGCLRTVAQLRKEGVI